MINTNLDFMNLIKDIALGLNARSVRLINDKKYRFYLTDKKVIDIPKKEIELEFLTQVNIDVIQ